MGSEAPDNGDLAAVTADAKGVPPAAEVVAVTAAVDHRGGGSIDAKGMPTAADLVAGNAAGDHNALGSIDAKGRKVLELTAARQYAAAEQN